MKSKARIQFVGEDEYTTEASQKLFGFLRDVGLYEAVQLVDPGVGELDSVDIYFGRFNMKSQIHWLSIFLLDWHSWHFVGQTCPNVFKGVTHRKERQHMHKVPHPMRGDAWVCQEIKCRVHLAPSSDDFMSLSEFRMTSQVLQNDPAPIQKVAVPVWKQETVSKPYKEEGVTTGRLSSNTKSMPPRSQDFSGIEYDILVRKIATLSESDAKTIIAKFYERFPVLKAYFEGVFIANLSIEKDRLETDLKDEKEGHENTQAARDYLQSELNKVRETPKNHPGLVVSADEMLRFLAGLNMQDHSLQDQREFRDKFTILKNAVKEAKG